jgi:LuxR family maltose regulon positive regulatory protein
MDAAALLDNGLRTLARNNMDASPAAGVLLTGLAEVDYRHNQLGDAAKNLDRGLELVRPGGFIEILKTGAILKSKILAAGGDITGGLDALAEVLSFLDETGNRMTRVDIQAAVALLHTRANHKYEARAWAENQEAGFDGNPGLVRGEVLFTLARVLTRLDRIDEARSLLIKLEAEASRAGSRGRQAEAGLLLALLETKGGNRAEGFGYLSAALTVTARTGDLRLFLDEGPVLLGLLEDYAKNERVEKPVSDFIQALVAAGGKSGIVPVQVGLVEKLSERELQVLALMSEGLTNPEIAGRLFLSLATIKTHLNNIYGKLNARNRADAVMRAKELHLL